MDERKVLIASDPSPSKICRIKIDTVPSPEIRKCQMPVRYLVNSTVKSRRKGKQRYSEPKKLHINLVRLGDHSKPSRVKKNLIPGKETKNDKIHKLGEEMHLNKCPNPTSDDKFTLPVTINPLEAIPSTSCSSENYSKQVQCLVKSSHSNDIGNLDETYIDEVFCTPKKRCTDSCKSKIRSALIQNVDSPCKKNETNPEVSNDILENNSDVVGKENADDLHNIDDPILSECNKQQEGIQVLENSEIVSSPDVSRSRRKKKYQPGSLVYRCRLVTNRVEKEKTLFSYEIESGLRSKSGLLVSTDLVVMSVCTQRGYEILHCRNISTLYETHQVQVGKILKYKTVVVSNKLDKKISVLSVINLHFPVTVILDLKLNTLFIFAGNRIVVKNTSMSPLLRDDEANTIKTKTSVDDLFLREPYKYGLDKVVRIINSNVVGSCILDCVISQPLIFEITLDAILLHIYKLSNDSNSWKAILCDKANQYCQLKVNTDLISNSNLEIDKLIAVEGSKIRTTGIRFIDFIPMDRTMTELINHLHKNDTNCNIIYDAEPVNTDFHIVCLQKSLWPKHCSSLQYILAEGKDFKRYSTRVDAIRMTFKGVIIGDSSLPDGVLLNGSDHLIFKPIKTPFIADVIFYLKGELHADMYSKVIVI